MGGEDRQTNGSGVRRWDHMHLRGRGRSVGEAAKAGWAKRRPGGGGLEALESRKGGGAYRIAPAGKGGIVRR